MEKSIEISKLKGMTIQQIIDLLNQDSSIEPQPSDGECLDGECDFPSTDEVVAVKIASISDSPEINFSVSDVNFIVLDDLDYSPGACSNSSIQILGKKMYMNVCDDDGKPYITLNIEVNGKFLNKVKFFVSTDSESPNTIDRSILNA